MTTSISIASYLLIVLALLAANLPFMNERFLGFISLNAMTNKSTESTKSIKFIKSLWIRLLELTLLYFLLGGVAYFIENKIGNVFAQRWEFYAVTICLFIVLAYPGFVFRYLKKQND